MKRTLGSLTLSSLILLSLSTQLFSETVFKKDGSLVTGTVVKDDPASITVKQADGALIIVDRANVLRVLYTQLYMGQVYIRLTSGKILDGYVVDEDQSTLTVRRELNNPEEFTIARDKIFFVARTNPN